MRLIPESDTEFAEAQITGVSGSRAEGWEIKWSDGWLFGVPGDSPVVPAVGMTARFYGQGIGHVVRGLVLDGQTVFYRTAAEDREHQENEMYGADAAEWLRRWDAGKSVWSITMGGIGPGYEQAIQITAAEVLRRMLEAKYDAPSWLNGAWQEDRKKIQEAVDANPVVDRLRLSGAQLGAATWLAAQLYMRGPKEIMTSSDIPRDRHIQVSRTFPQG